MSVKPAAAAPIAPPLLTVPFFNSQNLTSKPPVAPSPATEDRASLQLLQDQKKLDNEYKNLQQLGREMTSVLELSTQNSFYGK